MPKYYLLSKEQVDRLPWVKKPVWLLEAGVFYLLLGVARALPFGVASALFARGLGAVGYHNTSKHRAVTRNMAHVLPQASEATRDRALRGVFRSTGRAAVELFLMPRIWRQRARRLEFVLDPQAEAAIRAKAPIIFATAHTGAWQLSPLIGRQYDISISVLYTPERNPWLNRFFLARRRAFGGPLVPTTGGGREMLRELAAGRSVGAAFDTRVDQGEMVPFFDVPTPTTTLPAMLALRGYPLIPTRVTRLPRGRFRIEVLAPLTPRDPEAPRKAQIMDLTTQINDVVETWIAEDPGQWICMKRRWPKHRPAPQDTPDA